MNTTEYRQSNTSDYEIGSPEYKAAWLAWTLRKHADDVDALADKVEHWGREQRTAYSALGLIEAGQDLVRAAERIYSDPLIGDRTKCSYLNDASIALGATNGHSARGRGDLSYALMHALYQGEKYGEDSAMMKLDVKASSMRVHASGSRVIACLADDLATGRIRYIR